MPGYKKGRQTQESLRETKRLLERVVRDIEDLAVGMGVHQVDALMIENDASLERALSALPNWVEHGNTALRNLLKDRKPRKK